MLAIVNDHLGTPKEMFDAKGTLLWAGDHHVWGAIRTTRTFGSLAALPKHDRPPEELHCPWRFQGQYEDAETGLCYNRHRHYDPLTGQYASPDPIGLAGGDRPQGYVANPNALVDVFGLSALLPDLTQRPAALLTDQNTSTKPDFYVNSSGDALKSTGYRFMRLFDNDGVTVNQFVDKTITVKSAPGGYFGFEDFQTGRDARNAFQIKGPEHPNAWSDARLKGEFDTLQLFDANTGAVNARIPMEAGNDGSILEPFTRYYPEYGDGGIQQLITKQPLDFDKVTILPEK